MEHSKMVDGGGTRRHLAGSEAPLERRQRIIRRSLMAGSCLADTSLPFVAIAQEAGGQSDGATLLQQIVVTATGFEQNVKDAPASITVITREELEKGNFRDLTDALRDVQGVAVTGVANEKDILIRGL